jgi:hypothetical protein
MTQEFVTLPREVVEQALAALDAEDPYRAAIVLRAALEQHQQKASSSNDLPAETGDLSSSAKSRWKWVAVEPTKEMCQAGEIEMTTYGADASPSGIYKAMLKVAPQQPTTEQSSAVQQPQGEQDPVATLHCTDECYVYASVTDSGKQMRFEHPLSIYTYPPALRKPLTVEQIAAATGAKPGTPTWLVAVAFTRAVEAAHNIK